MSQRTARRRRVQARNQYRHLSPQQRPHFKMRDAAAATRRERMAAQKRAVLQSRGVKVR